MRCILLFLAAELVFGGGALPVTAAAEVTLAGACPTTGVVFLLE